MRSVTGPLVFLLDRATDLFFEHFHGTHRRTQEEMINGAPLTLWMVTSCLVKFLHLPEQIPRLDPLHLLAPPRRWSSICKSRSCSSSTTLKKTFRLSDSQEPGLVHPEHHFSIRDEIFFTFNSYPCHLNKINKKIIETALSDNNALFWYLNNGITITCDSFSYPKGKRAPIVELTRMQIVNGGQTSNALFEAYQQDPRKLEDVLVLVRIIETKSQPVSSAIAESTNSQTPIKGRDLRSNDDIQKKLEEAFFSMGIYYERKLKQHQDRIGHLRIDALTAGQAHLAYGLELPEVAKKDRGRIFADLYDTVFTDELTVDNLLVPIKLLNEIEKRKKVIQKSVRNQEPFDVARLYLIDGAYHVLFTVGQLCDRYDKGRLDLDFAFSIINKAIDTVAQVVKIEQDKDQAFSFTRFFKDAKSKTKIAAYVQTEK